MPPVDNPPVYSPPVAHDMTAPAAVVAAHDVYAFHDPHVLGTRLNLLVRAEGQAGAYAAARAARAEIDRLDRVFNWREPASELSRLNRSARHEASVDLFAVVAAAERWRTLSAGAVSGRMGRLLQVWREARETPDPRDMARLAREIADADVALDAAARIITRPESVAFDLDALAKGYIVDRALAAAMAAPDVTGAMLDIGGDIRCAGKGPCDGRWLIGLPQPLSTFDNAPACGAFELGEGAVATSGCGPRDLGAGGARAATLDPRTGWPVAHRRSATAAAESAMEADALATAMLVSSEDEAQALIARTPGAAARVTTPERAVWLGQDQAPLFRWIDYEAPQDGGKKPLYQSGWPDGWIANVTFTAPPKDMRREIAFRSPYVALWVTDMEGKPVRTLLLIGRYKDWHEGNHVWWRQNRAKLDELFAGRSMSTRGSGTYKIYWDGIDDAGKPVKPGRYVMNVETSRERGGHSWRRLEIDFSTMRKFEQDIPMDAEAGGLTVSFEKFGPG